MITKQKKISLWIIWAVIWPAIIMLVYQTQAPAFEDAGLDILFFAFFMFIVALFPIIVNDTPVFFIHGISLVVFLYFGLFAEMMLTQLAYLVLFIKLRLAKEDHYKIPLNLLMFMFVSLGSAAVYYLLGGTHGVINIRSAQELLPVLVYPLAVICINQLFLLGIKRLLFQQQVRMIDKSLIWELVNNLFVLPVGLVLYILYIEIGIAALFYVGVPFISLSIILMLYYRSRRINSYLQRTSDIGHALTEKLEVSEVLDRFVDNISSLLEVDYAYVFDAEKEERLSLIRFHDKHQRKQLPEVTLHKFEGVSGRVLGNKRGLYYRYRKQWASIAPEYVPEDVESIISLPIDRNQQVVGVLTLASSKKRAYEKYQYMIANILTNYLAVAIENARNYEQTKRESEICPLTGLYNYRYFEKKLQEHFQYMQEDDSPKPMSLVLIDLDHFKQVNDKYGHESGNEALIELANRLTSIIGDKGTVARYGGEEFIILLPNVSQEHALHIAEHVRRKIANEPFFLHEHILEQKGPLEAHITASIGVATYPDDCQEPVELIRHADRAMYMGAKRKGRNKVASYERLSETAE
ncbi:diguanylate cyclase domain-containing protein [Pontibacillus salicampi]|uniref:Diguanylate cyclase domain-containing protein n=1 Tax=Pontibacillus salicampi TaxID=1449801 RepID=A0ABV6LJD4_9BACI